MYKFRKHQYRITCKKITTEGEIRGLQIEPASRSPKSEKSSLSSSEMMKPRNAEPTNNNGTTNTSPKFKLSLQPLSLKSKNSLKKNNKTINATSSTLSTKSSSSSPSPSNNPINYIRSKSASSITISNPIQYDYQFNTVNRNNENVGKGQYNKNEFDQSSQLYKPFIGIGLKKEEFFKESIVVCENFFRFAY